MNRKVLWMIVLCWATSFHTSLFADQVDLFKDFAKPDGRAEQMFASINGKPWKHSREFKASPCGGCSDWSVVFEESVLLNGSLKDLRMRSRSNRNGVHQESLFVTGPEVAHIAFVKQRTKTESSTELLFSVRTKPFFWEAQTPKRIEWALLQDGYFTMEPNYDGIRSTYWRNYKSHTPQESLVSIRYLILQFDSSAPTKLTLKGYPEMNSTPIERTFEAAEIGDSLPNSPLGGIR